ncbi:hypothetical protein [Candidatus Thiosymbion oneisti]|uniref:hypothetical protein n=1 Tax=Candidatus Thiosymbion oneisti TaxID=589554 RepID=UPI00159F0847|nr:hypothetical protein [Candidatus Thiosymbion oneisti]
MQKNWLTPAKIILFLDGWFQANAIKLIEFHLEGIREEGMPLPQPHSYSEFVEVHA